MKEQLMRVGFVPSHRVAELSFDVQCKREPLCWYHGKKYWCLFEDSRWDDSHDLRLLEPYKWDDGKDGPMYGWTDGLNVFDESSSPMHNDENCVTMFKLQDV